MRRYIRSQSDVRCTWHLNVSLAALSGQWQESLQRLKVLVPKWSEQEGGAKSLKRVWEAEVKSRIEEGLLCRMGPPLCKPEPPLPLEPPPPLLEPWAAQQAQSPPPSPRHWPPLPLEPPPPLLEPWAAQQAQSPPPSPRHWPPLHLEPPPPTEPWPPLLCWRRRWFQGRPLPLEPQPLPLEPQPLPLEPQPLPTEPWPPLPLEPPPPCVEPLQAQQTQSPPAQGVIFFNPRWKTRLHTNEVLSV